MFGGFSIKAEFILCIENLAVTLAERYNITDIKKAEELENKGYEAIKKTNPSITINPHPTQLIGLEKDKIQHFQIKF